MSIITKISIFLLCLTVPLLSHAQTAQLVKDINTTSFFPLSSEPDELININGIIYFSAQDSAHGRELWKTDGTEAGTVLIKDILPGQRGSELRQFSNVNNRLYFFANTEQQRWALWKSDGTEAGTVVVKVLPANTRITHPDALASIDETFIFTSASFILGTDLWVSDGTNEGSIPLLHIDVNNTIKSITNVNGSVFFVISNEVSGVDTLWTSDRTNEGTIKLKEFSGSNNISSLTSVNGTLYFTTRNDAAGTGKLWKSDGTTIGTVLVKDSASWAGGSLPFYLTEMNGALFFIASGDALRLSLWRSDGTTEGTIIVKNDAYNFGIGAKKIININGILFISTGTDLLKIENEVSLIKQFTESGGYIYSWFEFKKILFFLVQYDDRIELWTSDGTNNSANRVKILDLDPNPSIGFDYGRGFEDTYFYFYINGKLWVSDGTEVGTTQIEIARPYPIYQAISSNDSVIFVATDDLYGTELWISDGTAASTRLLKDIEPKKVSNSNPSKLIALGDTLFFTAWGNEQYLGLWKTDNTSTELVKAIRIVSPLTVFRGELFFSAYDETNGVELWKSDGTAEGTVMLKDIYAGEYSSDPSSFTVVNDVLFFVAIDGIHGPEVWKSDGTTSGTMLLADVIPLDNDYWSSYYFQLTEFKGELYFFSRRGSYGLWKSDGSAAGTTLVTRIGGEVEISLYNLMVTNNALFFKGFNEKDGVELWTSDGTADGTNVVRSFNPENVDSYGFWYPAALGSDLFFTAWDSVHGVELWKSDGTSTGTGLFKDITPSGDAIPSDLISINKVLYFSADDGVHGTELWRSDGTDAGTFMVMDIQPGAAHSNFGSFAEVKGLLYFSVEKNDVWSLWKTNGTTAGTEYVAKLPGLIDPLNAITATETTIYFSADDGVSGFELWKIELAENASTTATGVTINAEVENDVAGDKQSDGGGGALGFLVFFALMRLLWQANTRVT